MSAEFEQQYFKVIDTEEKAYWLGFLFADGSVEWGKSVKLALSEKDRDHVEKFAKVFDRRTYELDIRDKKTGKVWREVLAKIGCQEMTWDLGKFGLGPNKTLNYEGSPFTKFSKDFWRHFVRGFYDGDGSYSLGHMRLRVPHLRIVFYGSKGFLSDLEEVVAGEVQVNRQNINKVGSFNCCRLEYGSNRQSSAVIKWMYEGATVFLSRKKKKLEELWQISGALVT